MGKRIFLLHLDSNTHPIHGLIVNSSHINSPLWLKKSGFQKKDRIRMYFLLNPFIKIWQFYCIGLNEDKYIHVRDGFLFSNPYQTGKRTQRRRSIAMDKPFPFVNIVQKNGIAWSIPQGSSRIKFVPVATMKRVTKVLDSWIEMLNAFRAIWMLQEPRNDLKIKEFNVLYHKLGFDLFFLKRLIHQISQIVWKLYSFEKHLQTIIQL